MRRRHFLDAGALLLQRVNLITQAPADLLMMQPLLVLAHAVFPARSLRSVGSMPGVCARSARHGVTRLGVFHDSATATHAHKRQFAAVNSLQQSLAVVSRCDAADMNRLSGHPGPRQYIIACGLQQHIAPAVLPGRAIRRIAPSLVRKRRPSSMLRLGRLNTPGMRRRIGVTSLRASF